MGWRFHTTTITLDSYLLRLIGVKFRKYCRNNEIDRFFFNPRSGFWDESREWEKLAVITIAKILITNGKTGKDAKITSHVTLDQIKNACLDYIAEGRPDVIAALNLNTIADPDDIRKNSAVRARQSSFPKEPYITMRKYPNNHTMNLIIAYIS